MTSFIIISRDKNKRLAYARDYCTTLAIDNFDITLIEKDPESKNSQSIGIEDIKTIHKKIFLKPFKSETKAIIINDSHLLTIEAQNALLKILEEPPANTIIVISIPKKELMLPTILSRCKIIEIKEEQVSLTPPENSKLDIDLNIILNGKVGDRLKIAQDVGTKEEAAIWLTKMSIFIRTKLIEDYSNSKYLNLLSSLQKTNMIVQSTNVSQRVALENLFLAF